MSLKDWITATLQERLEPARLVVEDESHRHVGHAGWREGGETHFRHRMVNAALAGAFERGLHALAIQAKAPGE